MEILELIDALEELVMQARRLPVGGNLVVDRKRVLDVIDQMRLAVPADLREATQVLETRDQILAEARDHARALVEQAERERTRRLNESEILAEAQERSQHMLIDAEARAREIITDAESTAATHLTEAANASRQQMMDADQYALEILHRTEQQLQSFLESIRQSIDIVQQRR